MLSKAVSDSVGEMILIASSFPIGTANPFATSATLLAVEIVLPMLVYARSDIHGERSVM